jgi:hypothetical protein
MASEILEEDGQTFGIDFVSNCFNGPEESLSLVIFEMGPRTSKSREETNASKQWIQLSRNCRFVIIIRRTQGKTFI